MKLENGFSQHLAMIFTASVPPRLYRSLASPTASIGATTAQVCDLLASP